MSITVTMLQTRRGEGGATWTAGNSYSASDAFGAYLITSNLATGVIPNPPPTSLSPADATAVQALVSGDRTVSLVEPAVQRWVIWGDSFAGQSVRTSSAITSMIVTSGVMAVIFSSAHGLYTGARMSVTGAELESQNVIQAPVTVSSTTALTLPAPGAPDGALVTTFAGLQAVMYDRQSPYGLQTHLQRLSNGGISVVNVAGYPGYSVASVALEFQRAVAAFSPDVVVIQEGYNSINAGVSEDSIYTDMVSQIDSVIGIGAVALVMSIAPWTTGAAANTLANRLKVQALNRRLAAYCAANNLARFLDISSLAIDPATGLARAGWMQADLIHPSVRFSYNLAKLALESMRIRPRKFVSSSEDSRAVDATSLNVARSMPAASTGGGLGTGGNINAPWTSGGTVVAGQIITAGPTGAGGYIYAVTVGGTLGATVPSHTSGSAANGAATLVYVATSASGIYSTVAAGIPQNWTGQSTGMAVQSGAVWTEAAPNGVGFACVGRWYATGASQIGRLTYTLTNADFTPGETVDLYCKLKLSTAHAASAATPAGQNIISVQGQLVFTNTAGTYTPGDWSSNVLASEMFTEDLTDACIVLEGVVVPDGSAITLARFDLNITFGGTGTAQAHVWQFEVRKRA